MDKPMEETLETAASDDAMSRTELQIEQEKLKLERERILLERARLENLSDRVSAQKNFLQTDPNGKLSVTLSTLILVSIICLLAGGILGAFSTSAHLDRRNTARLQEVMHTLASVSPDALDAVTNGSHSVTNELPAWLKAMKPQGAHAGISLVVIQ